MRTPERTPWSVLWFAGSVLLAAGYASTQDRTPPLPTNGPRFLTPPLCLEDRISGGLRCPHRNKSATLVPSFTKTTPTTPQPTMTHRHVTNHTTVHPQKHTTSHHHHHRTTSAHPQNHTTQHPTTDHHHHSRPTTHRPHPTSSPHHNTTAHTTQHPTTVHPHNRTTSHQPRPTPLPHHNTTAHPHNHTTAHSPTNQTTAPAVLTTLHYSTLTPHPTLAPSVLVGDYVVRNKTDVCLRAEMGLQMRVSYTGKAGQQVWGDFALQPNQTNATGSCLDKNATLNLHFPEGFLFFFFTKNETQNTYYLRRVQANLTYQFPQATETSFGADNSSLCEFEVHLGHSYQCRNRSLALAEGFGLNVLRERIQAFGLPGGTFGEAEVCPEQRRSNTLPIVVGVILGLLILIVIVAFLIGRQRKHSGYQTL